MQKTQKETSDDQPISAQNNKWGCKIRNKRKSMRIRQIQCLLFSFIVIQTSLYSQTTFVGQPEGTTKVSIPQGTGTSKKTQLLSIPLLGTAEINGKVAGEVGSFTATTITCPNANWTPSELSQTDKPHLIEITSGNAQGHMFLISRTIPNTTSTLTLDPTEVSRIGSLLETGLAAGDTFLIRPADTLLSFFGTPNSTLVYGGTSSAVADTITLVVNGSASSYFYNTGKNEWSKVSLGSPPSNHTAIMPYMGIQYARLFNTPLEIMSIGKVPFGNRKISIKKSGSTLVSNHWAQDKTLAQIGLQNSEGWITGNTGNVSDRVTLTFNGSVSTYFHDGLNWRRVALMNPLANNALVRKTDSMLISRTSNSTDIGHIVHTDQGPAPTSSY